ncbi:hypothetical protein [Rubellicoccus peritrichatus]|uniref:Uncharacterized protein n=1 Tax=Rubellicoccus peritrichatus TaxID=3080537 RepID=A0AAQ3LH08_9BACT|nr:hypothetical protein [Puniceicoccus sp. CR14]WOO41989.1 hypothetical protein RZN69_02735 [Puniceicoccus sp. CR14]
MNRFAVIVLCIVSAALGAVVGRLFVSEENSKRPVFRPPATLPTPQTSKDGEPVEAPAGPSFDETMAMLQDEDRSSFLERLEVNLAVASLSENEIQRALDLLKPNAGTKSEDQREVLEQMRQLLIYWAELDPEAAMSYVEDLDEDSRRSLSTSVMAIWAKISPYEALAYAQSVSDEKDSASMIRAVGNVMSDDDPVGAIELIASLPRPSGSNHYSWSHSKAQIIKNWADMDRDAALAYTYGIENARERKQILQNLANMFVQDDPVLALTLAGDADDRWFNSSGNVISNWARYDEDAAWSYLLSLDEGKRKQRLVSRYYSQKGQDDPQAAIVEIQSTLSGRTRRDSLSNVVSNWVRNDFDQATAYLSSMSLKDRNEIMNRISYSLGDSDADPQVALAWIIENTGGNARTNAMRNIVDRVSQEDPGMALELLDSLPYGRSYTDAVRNLARNWSGQDPESAYAWLNTLPLGPERENAFRSFSREAAQLDADRAYVIASQMPEGRERREMLNQVAKAKAESDPRATASWVMSFPDEELRNSAMREVVSAWAESDPQAAVHFLQSSNDDNLQDNAYRQLAARWGRNDPESAANWVLTLPEDKIEKAVGGVTSSWLDHDMFAASEWVSNLPKGNARQKAVESLVDKVYRIEPDAAFDWALEIEDENRRKNMTRRISYEWKKRDVNAARQLVTASTLPEGEKEELLKSLE